MSVYRVVGTQRYLGYRPGQTFIGSLSPQAEARAIARGSIELVEEVVTALDSARCQPPLAWAKGAL